MSRLWDVRPVIQCAALHHANVPFLWVVVSPRQRGRGVGFSGVVTLGVVAGEAGDSMRPCSSMLGPTKVDGRDDENHATGIDDYGFGIHGKNLLYVLFPPGRIQNTGNRVGDGVKDVDCGFGLHHFTAIYRIRTW